jgi:hypothetical protein
MRRRAPAAVSLPHQAKAANGADDPTIANPKVVPVPRCFAGIQKDSERADVIAYLATLADKPVPLPTAAK